MRQRTDQVREPAVRRLSGEAEPGIPRFSDEALLLIDAPVPGRRAAAPVGNIRIVAVSSLERLASIEAEWQELGARAAEPNPFYEPWMLLPALAPVVVSICCLSIGDALLQGRRSMPL